MTTEQEGSINTQAEHLASKYVGTGRANTTRFEWACHVKRWVLLARRDSHSRYALRPDSLTRATRFALTRPLALRASLVRQGHDRRHRRQPFDGQLSGDRCEREHRTGQVPDETEHADALRRAAARCRRRGSVRERSPRERPANGEDQSTSSPSLPHPAPRSQSRSLQVNT